MWVLIITAYFNITGADKAISIHSVDGFTTAKSCADAGKFYLNSKKHTYDVNTVCVKK
jgi:hypothetical protein